jgi:hypothetical protein
VAEQLLEAVEHQCRLTSKNLDRCELEVHHWLKVWSRTAR